MFAAQIHHKLTRSEKDMEDLLTSNVFGVWRYLEPHHGLVQFLQTAEPYEGRGLGLDEVETALIKFWPWVEEKGGNGVVPDVVIEITTPHKEKWLIFVEAKYLSGKSSFPVEGEDEGHKVKDQLAKEMENLRKQAQRLGFSQHALIYITKHTLMPRADIAESVLELGKITGDRSASKFYWTTWRRLPDILFKTSASCEKVAAGILSDLRTILLEMGLTFFQGMTSKGWTMGETPWDFERPPVFFDWLPIEMGQYTFEKAPVKFSWASDRLSDKFLWRWS